MSIDTLINALALLVPVFLFVLGTTWGVVGFLVNSLKKAITDRLDALAASLNEESRKIAHVERSLLELKADLPREYQRREDHIRYSAVIEAKIDAQGVKADALSDALQDLALKVQRALDSTNKGGTQQ